MTDTELKPEYFKLNKLFKNIQYAKNMQFYANAKKTFLLSFGLYFGVCFVFMATLNVFLVYKGLSLMPGMMTFLITSFFSLSFLSYIHYSGFISSLRRSVVQEDKPHEFIAFHEKIQLSVIVASEKRKTKKERL